MTVAPVVPDLVQQRLGELVFEDIGFDALSQVCSQSMVAPELGAGLVIDSGYSNTYIVPFFQGMPMKHCATRLDVGGKLLTNLLMETLSYKEINLKGESFLV